MWEGVCGGMYGGVCGERVCGGVCEKGEGVWLWSVRCVEVQLYIPP